MARIKLLAEKDVDTENKQAHAISQIAKVLASSNTENQVIAHDLATIASSDTETPVSDDLLDSLRENYVSNVALWYEESWNHVHYDDSNSTDRQVLPELKADMQFCHEQHIDPNDYWVTIDGNGDIQPVDTDTLQYIVKSVTMSD